jgi:hydroxymethylpyrimidine/phosphomethylpyrimidine kinase
MKPKPREQDHARTSAMSGSPRASPRASAHESLRAHARPRLPCALAIGGLDPGGGAGLAADLRAFAAAGVFGCAAVAVVTVQSTAGLRSARPVSPRELVAQAAEVLDHQRVRAVKVGALGSEVNVRAVARLLARHEEILMVVDTPILPSRGRARLLAAGALTALREQLLARATLVTVNLSEAQALLGEPVRTVGEAHDAAGALASAGARAVLVKGGHMEGASAIDVLCVDGEVIELRARRLELGPVHGTGCTLASLVAGRIARREGALLSHEELVAAIRWAKRVHHAALARAVDVGGPMRVLVF